MKELFKDLEFTHPSNGNAPDYDDIKTEESWGQSATTYYLDTTKGNDSLMRGKGIADMQIKLAVCFRMFNLDLYKTFFEDPEFKKHTTKGVYGPKTFTMITEFQKRYMKSHFEKVNWDPLKGFGSFGGHTKKRLDVMYNSARKEYRKSKKGKMDMADLEDYYKEIGSGY